MHVTQGCSTGEVIQNLTREKMAISTALRQKHSSTVTYNLQPCYQFCEALGTGLL